MKEQGQGLGFAASGMNGYRGSMTGGGASGWGTSSHMSGVSEAFPSGSPGNATTTLTPGGGGGGGGGASLMSEKDRERDSVRQIVTQLRQVSHHTLTYPYLTPSQHIPTYLNCISNLLCVSGLILSISPSNPSLTSYHNPSNLPPPPLSQDNTELRHRLRQAESRAAQGTGLAAKGQGLGSKGTGAAVAREAELLATNSKLRKQVDYDDDDDHDDDCYCCYYYSSHTHHYPPNTNIHTDPIHQ